MIPGSDLLISSQDQERIGNKQLKFVFNQLKQNKRKTKGWENSYVHKRIIILFVVDQQKSYLLYFMANAYHFQRNKGNNQNSLQLSTIKPPIYTQWNTLMILLLRSIESYLIVSDKSKRCEHILIVSLFACLRLFLFHHR